jgi:hypothetical protein
MDVVPCRCGEDVGRRAEKRLDRRFPEDRFAVVGSEVDQRISPLDLTKLGDPGRYSLMYVVTLTRSLTVLPEVYGCVSFDGREVTYKGLTCVFRRYLERGIVGQHNRSYVPSDGMDFLRNLKYHFADDMLRAARSPVFVFR